MKIIFSLLFSLLGLSIYAQTFTEDVAEIIYNKEFIEFKIGFSKTLLKVGA